MIRSSAKWICRRSIIGAAIVLVGVFTPQALFAQSTDSSSSTEKIPIKSWLDGKNISQIPWTIKVVPPDLTDYQRYQASILAYVSLDKMDAAHSRAKLLAIARFTDSHGKSYEATNVHGMSARGADIIATRYFRN
jgi:hypothetical protein